MITAFSVAVSGFQPDSGSVLSNKAANGKGSDFCVMLDAVGAKLDLDSNRSFIEKEIAPLQEKLDTPEKNEISPDTLIVPEDTASRLFEPTDSESLRSETEESEDETDDLTGPEKESGTSFPVVNEWFFDLDRILPEMTQTVEQVAPEDAAGMKPTSVLEGEVQAPKLTGFGINTEARPVATDQPDTDPHPKAAENPNLSAVTPTTGNQPVERAVSVPSESNGAPQPATVTTTPADSFPRQIRMSLNGYETNAPVTGSTVSKPVESLAAANISVDLKPREVRKDSIGSLEAKIAQITTKVESLPETVQPLQQSVAATAEPNGMKCESQVGAENAISTPTGEAVETKSTGKPVIPAVVPNRIPESLSLKANLQVNHGKGATFEAADSAFGLTGIENLTECGNTAESVSTLDMTTTEIKQALKGKPDLQIQGEFQAEPQLQLKETTFQFEEATGARTSRSMEKNELFSQIVEHGKLMVNNGHNEMELHLKPDHLGRLKLQISLENQIVTARFVAESEQVKQIIESGLTDLKRALQDNGIQADYLIVSTGQSDAGAESFQQSFFQQSGANSQRSFSPHQSLASSRELENLQEKPQVTRQSMIDLIA
jgi:flagellar hook-length control protein FliK